METISHREMRNRSGTYLRRVEAGESFLVSNNGTVVALLGPPDMLSGIEVARRRGQSRPAHATAEGFGAIARRKATSTSAEIVADTRGRW
ncbi:MAG: type II toxin-antitoxin system prevent-host-death family antitoxin [Acidimicrobiales bacterium]|nr:type II toxin-antitoxin system prevent-host-death family antitoxin [Acidimicrobiales bacterium]